MSRVHRIEFVLFNWHTDGHLRVVTAAHMDKGELDERIECIEISRDANNRKSSNYFRGMTARKSVAALKASWTRIGFKSTPSNALDLELARPYLTEDVYLGFRKRFCTKLPQVSLRSRFQAFV